MTIRDILVRKIFDSRGEETIEVGIISDKGVPFFAQIPSGKSKGENEATALSYEQARHSVDNLKHILNGKDFISIRLFDNALLLYDDSFNKFKIGGNVSLGVSLAFARYLAYEKKQELWELLREEFFKDVDEKRNPLIFSNLINGGAHARNNLDIQEYMVVVRMRNSFYDSVAKLINFYRVLGASLRKKYNIEIIPIGDEGGYAINFKDNFEPISVLEQVIHGLKLELLFSIGIDAAASSFYKDGRYNFGHSPLSREELADVYEEYFKKSAFLCTIEDPFCESDSAGFKLLRNKLGKKWIIGDDLTVTNPKLIRKYASDNSIGGVIIKPNQIGTVSESCEAMNVARKNGVKTIVSHRSGETEDNFIIHLAKAGAADGVKIGAPIRERVSKFNELVRLYG